jgi:predicted TIM-barrel fold metal-dependent hydrolase
MKIIDAHMHYSKIEALRLGAIDAGVDYSTVGLAKEYSESGVVGCVCMGLSETAPGLTPDRLAQTPMYIDLGPPPIPMGVCLGINPHNLDSDAIERAKQALALKRDIAGFKIYAGYYHIDINDECYSQIYDIAADNGLSVAIHGGETYFKGGLVEYSRPLHVDKLAHAYPDLKIIICHLGFPWVMEACEIATKNPNVYVDISGLAVGSARECERLRGEPLILDYFRQGLVFLNDYSKVIFGTDWPLVPIAPYIKACKALIPENAWEDVFRNNALKVYNI